MMSEWMLIEARRRSTAELKDQIWLEVECGQPIPGCLSIEACRAVLIERGEDGKGYHGA